MRTSENGIELIKEFEGLEERAYPDPGSGGDPWTIGYGHTGPDVYPGLVISKSRAEELLVEDLHRFEDAVETLIDVELNQNEFDALVSFAYNVGEGALGDSTLRRRLNAEEDKCPVFQQELPRWVKGGNGPMPGLVRRREAEAKLACTPVIQSQETFLLRAVRYFEEERHQIDALNALWDGLTSSERDWFVTAYRAAETPAEPDDKDFFPLDVPYFYQRDSKTGNGERSCFSSSMAMALDYLRPEVIEGDDDWYLGIVFYFGDTVSVDAQVKAARSLGFKANFHMDGTKEDLERQIDNDVPVPMGILHKGPLSSPTGGGHYICLVGYNETEFIVHDPYGRMDLDNGGYAAAGPTDGKFVRYDKKKLLKRWLIASDHDGWWMELS